MAETLELRAPVAPRNELILENTGGGRIAVVVDGASVTVRVRECFPWSEPGRYLSLRNEDDEEVAFVEDPALLHDASRRVLESALAEAGFVIEVLRVVAIDEEVEIRQWTIETRNGRRHFQTHLDDWPRRLPMGGLLIRDVGGDLYRLPEPSALDRRSRELLWAFVD